MEKPDVVLCERIIMNLKMLRENDGVFSEGEKSAKEKERRGDSAFMLAQLEAPLPSILTFPARTALRVLIRQLGLQSLYNIENGFSSPIDFDNLLKDAEEVVALFK